MPSDYEHFEHHRPRAELNLVKGNKGEYFMLVLLFGLGPLLWNGRKNNEDGIAAEIKTTNTYSRMQLDEESSKPSTWS